MDTANTVGEKFSIGKFTWISDFCTVNMLIISIELIWVEKPWSFGMAVVPLCSYEQKIFTGIFTGFYFKMKNFVA